MNGGMIPRGCSHGFIQYFPLIARVRTRANVNKMLTEKKVCRHEGQFQVCEEPMHHPDGTRRIGDLRKNASTPPHICSFPIILYTRIVVNAKSDAFPLRRLVSCVDNLIHIGYNLPLSNPLESSRLNNTRVGAVGDRQIGNIPPITLQTLLPSKKMTSVRFTRTW